MGKYAMPSASRIDAFSGSRRLAFSSATVACAAWPFLRCVFPCWKRSYVSWSLIEVRKILPNQVYRMRQVAGSRDNHGANMPRAREGVGELERRARKILEERHERSADAPERDTGQAGGVVKEARDTRVERHVAAPCRDGAGRVGPVGEKRLERAAREDVVGACYQRRRLGAAGEGAAHGVGGAVGPRLPDVADAGAERGAVAEQLFDLLGEVTGHHRHVFASCGREVVHERCDHGSTVDG